MAISRKTGREHLCKQARLGYRHTSRAPNNMWFLFFRGLTAGKKNNGRICGLI
jgi:hypothetical protein